MDSPELPPPPVAPKPPQNPALMLLGVAVFALGGLLFLGALWCVLDGIVTYPLRLERYDAFVELVDPDGDGVPRVDYADMWRKHAAAQGWPESIPPATSKYDVYTQYILAGICGISSAVFLMVGGALVIRKPRKEREA